MNKQTRDGLILGVGVLVLVIVGYYSLKGSTPTPAPPAVTADAGATGTDTAATTGQPGANGQLKRAKTKPVDEMAWVKQGQLPTLVAEVRGGRDPFHDLFLPVVKPGKAAPSPIPPAGEKIGALPPAEKSTRKTVFLDGVALADLQQACAQANLAVAISPGSQSDTAVLTGARVDVARAQAVLAKEQLQLAPPFSLVGVMVIPGQRSYALLMDGNKQYGAYEGEKIPDGGWTILKITSTGVMLGRGTRHIQLRLAGGKVS